MPRRRFMRMLLCIAAGIAPAATAIAQREAPEASVKAAFLYKFANYIEWPANAFAAPAAPLVIGVAGSDEVAAELERIAPGRNVNGHPVAVKRVREGQSPGGVHLLFIGRDNGALAPILRAARDNSVLAITETERGLEMGSAINFVTAGDRVAFEVSLEAADKTGHRISSRMLAVARRVLPKAS